MKYLQIIVLILGCLFLACATQESTPESQKVLPKDQESDKTPENVAKQAEHPTENQSLRKLDEYLGGLSPEIIKEVDLSLASETSAADRENPPLPKQTPLPDSPPVTLQVQVVPSITDGPLSQQELAEKHGVRLNFDNASIYDVTKVVSEITGKSFIIDEKVEDVERVTVFSPDLLSPDQVFELYKSVLELHGLAITRIGDFYKIVQTDDAKKRYIPVDTEGFPGEDDRLITQIVKLKHVSAEEVKNALAPLTSADIITYVDPEKGDMLIITDLASNVRKILAVIEEIDVSKYANRYFEIFPIKHADLLELVNDLNQILSLQEITAPTPSVQQPQPVQPTPAEEEQPQAQPQPTPTVSPVVAPGTKTKLYPITRLNALAVSTNNPEVIALVRKWIDILDQPSAREYVSDEPDEDEQITHVYFVKYAKAEDLAPLLVQVYDQAIQQQQQQQEQQEQQQPEQQETENPEIPAPEFIAEPKTNSLIIKATEGQYTDILSLLDKLDHRPLQVLIDVIIAEITLDDSETLGIKGTLFGQDQVTIGGETNSIETTAETVFDDVAPEGAQGFLYTVSAPGRFLAQIRALAAQNKVKVLSDPHVLVRNNEEAIMNVGGRIPIKETTGTGEDLRENIRYENVGIILTVTPQITMDGDVVMTINQEISAVGQERFGDTGAASFTERQATTTVITRDGHPIILGGLIENRDEKNEIGIPLLKDLPIIGRLFRYTDKKNQRSDLFLLVTPRVIRTSDQGWNVTDDVLNRKIKKLEELFNREDTDADKIKQYLQDNFRIEK